MPEMWGLGWGTRRRLTFQARTNRVGEAEWVPMPIATIIVSVDLSSARVPLQSCVVYLAELRCRQTPWPARGGRSRAERAGLWEARTRRGKCQGHQRVSSSLQKSLKAGLHVRRKHKHKHKPRVNRNDASTSARKSRSAFLFLDACVVPVHTRGLCLCLCLRRMCKPDFTIHLHSGKFRKTLQPDSHI